MIYHFQFTERVELKAPWESESPFVTIGPFQTENLLNIVAIKSALDYDNPIYQEVWEAGIPSRIDAFRKWMEKWGFWENGHLGRNAGDASVFL